MKGTVQLADINTKNHGKLCHATIGRPMQKVRQDIQTLIVFGLMEYGRSGNSGFLTNVIVTSEASRSIPTRNLIAYIQTYAPSLKWLANAKGKRFVKRKSDDELANTLTELPNQVWWEHETNNNTKANKSIDIHAIALKLVREAGKAGKSEAEVMAEVKMAYRELSMKAAKKTA